MGSPPPQMCVVYLQLDWTFCRISIYNLEELKQNSTLHKAGFSRWSSLFHLSSYRGGKLSQRLYVYLKLTQYQNCSVLTQESWAREAISAAKQLWQRVESQEDFNRSSGWQKQRKLSQESAMPVKRQMMALKYKITFKKIKMEAIHFYVGSFCGIPCFRTYLNTGGCADITNHSSALSLWQV